MYKQLKVMTMIFIVLFITVPQVTVIINKENNHYLDQITLYSFIPTENMDEANMGYNPQTHIYEVKDFSAFGNNSDVNSIVNKKVHDFTLLNMTDDLDYKAVNASSDFLGVIQVENYTTGIKFTKTEMDIDESNATSFNSETGEYVTTLIPNYFISEEVLNRLLPLIYDLCNILIILSIYGVAILLVLIAYLLVRNDLTKKAKLVTIVISLILINTIYYISSLRVSDIDVLLINILYLPVLLRIYFSKS